MRLNDFFLLVLICLFFGINFVMASWALGTHGVPPFMLAALRAAFVVLFLCPYICRPLPLKFGRLMVVCLCVGPLHLGFLYTGLMTASASSGSIMSQMVIPMATILSMVFLKERVRWVRGLGIVGAFIGTIIMIYEPSALSFNWGLIFVMLAYVGIAVGSVVMKTVGHIDWQVYVLWMGISVLVSMSVMSWWLEPPLTQVLATSKWPLLITALYAAVGVSIFAHGQYFNLVKRYEVSLVVPLTLMVPVFGTILGIWLLNERLTPQIIMGAALILPCVYVIAKRQRPSARPAVVVNDQ